MASTTNFGYNIGDVLKEYLDDPIFILNKDYEIEYATENLHVKNLGLTSLGGKITDFLHPNDSQRGVDFLQNLSKFEAPAVTLRVRYADNFRFYEFKGRLFKNEAQETKYLITTRDVTLYKKKEEAWNKKEEDLKKLAESMQEIRFWKLLLTKDEKISFQKSIAFEKKYRQIIDNIKEAYFEVDLKGNFTYINKSFTKMTGYPFDELMKLNYNHIMDDENKTKVYDIFNLVYKSGLPQEYFQFEFIKKGNTKVIVETSVYLNKDTYGKKIGFYGISRDITQRSILEHKFKQSEEKYRHLFERSPYAIWIVDLHGVLIDCNPTTNIIFPKHTRENLIGKNFVEVLGMLERPEYFIPYFKSKFESFVQDKPMKSLEFKMTRSDGIKKWITISSSKIKLGDETLIQVLIQDITEKKLADLKLQKSEEELKILNKELEKKVRERTKELMESEEKFRTIAESSLMGIAIIQDNKIKYVNQLSTNLTGYTVDETKELSPAKVFEFIHPEDRNWVVEQLKKKQSGSSDYITNYQYRIINKLGEIRWLDNYSKSIEYRGKPADLVTVLDITERKKAEQKLKESEEKFRTITEHSSIGIIIIQDDKVKYVNKAMSDINEFTLDEMKEWSPKELIINIHPEDRKQAIEYLKSRQTGDFTLPAYSSYRVITKGGKIKWIDSYSKSITYLGRFADLALITDVTEQNLARQEIKESEEKYRHLFENSPFSIVLLNDECKIIDTNPKTAELFGYKKEDLVDKNYLNLMDIFPEETIPGLRLVQDLMSKGEPSNPITKPQITKVYNKEKKAMWVTSELSTVNISGELMILAIIQDITEKKLAEEKLKESERILRQQNIELKELDRLKTDFISIAAHDLKTPLISVGGYVDLILLREKGLKEEVKEDLSRVLNNVHRLDRYINRLLDVMKIEAKKVELVKREENIHTIIIDCLSDLEFQISQKDLTVNVDISKNLNMRVDNFRISQAILNLLSNAVKFTPKNGKIDISINEEDERVLFKIKDSGKGLTPEEIQKLFGKFVTIEQGVDGYSTFDKGSGLGLYIARGFIEAHGGKIWVESKGRDLGAEFIFTLPKQ